MTSGSVCISAQEAHLVPPRLSAADAALPDAPSAIRDSGSVASMATSSVAFVDAYSEGIPFFPLKAVPPVAPKSKSRILAGQTAMPLSSRDKLILSVRRETTVGQLAGILFSAGWTHLTDGRPHYGSDSAGFGERLGAAELRSITKSALNFGVLSAALHTDPRFYQLGSTAPVRKRFLYAATRVFVGRNDDGRDVPNVANMTAVAVSSVLTNLYYPQRDRSAERTIAGVFTSFAGRSATLEWSEFGPDILHRVLRRH